MTEALRVAFLRQKEPWCIRTPTRHPLIDTVTCSPSIHFIGGFLFLEALVRNGAPLDPGEPLGKGDLPEAPLVERGDRFPLGLRIDPRTQSPPVPAHPTKAMGMLGSERQRPRAKRSVSGLGLQNCVLSIWRNSVLVSRSHGDCPVPWEQAIDLALFVPFDDGGERG